MGWKSRAASAVWALMALSCSDEAGEGKGRLRILLQAEASITDGLDQGDDVENTKDFGVRFSKYLIAIGNVRLSKAASEAEASLPDVFIADLTQVGEQGVELGVLDNIATGQWDRFGYDTPAANSKTKKLGNVPDADFDLMVENGWTYWIEGEVLRDGDEPVRFVIQTETATVFEGCELDGEPGVAVSQDGSSATLTIHGDHIFFNAFPTGSEGSIERIAGWVIDADQDMDSQVNTEDLSAADATEVFTSTRGYSLDGAPIVIENALDYVRAQLATQGHFNGEGECSWEFEGAEGGHHDDEDHGVEDGHGDKE